jgi:3-oxoacyl-[acyl-carrier protein] reductase
MDLGLKDCVYIVSGASRGLGYATATELVADGARVVIASRSQESIDAAALTLGAPDRVIAVAADLAEADAAGRLVAAALSSFGQLDGAVISVGGPPPGTAAEVDDDTWRGAFESVFLGPLRLARATLSATQPPVSVTIVLSTSVRSPIAGLAVSNGLRPGLAMTAKTLADEYGPRGSRVNVLLPGRIATDRMKQLDDASGNADESRQRNNAGIPLGRYGKPEEFGRVAAFVASPAASYLSGSVITVDGGATRSL